VNDLCALEDAGGVTNWICVLPIFDRPNKIQKLSPFGACKDIWVPGGSLRRFGSPSGSATVATHVLLEKIVAETTRPLTCTSRIGCGVLADGACPSTY
jgi:hypothetical protein